MGGKAGQKTKAGRILPQIPNSKVFTAEQEMDIGRRWLHAEPVTSIARLYQVDKKTIYRLVVERLRPAWLEMAKRPLNEIMAEIQEMRRVAWKGYQDTLTGLTKEKVEEALTETGKAGKMSMALVKKVIEKIPNNTATAWLGVIQWCAEYEAKIYGHYAPAKTHLSVDGDFRVAGISPAALDLEMMTQLVDRMETRRAYEKQLQNLGMGPN